MKKLTIEKFIDRATSVHGDKYDYSKVNYINIDKEVIIICKEHGEFNQTPYNHLKGYDCPECSKIKRKYTFFKKFGVENPAQNNQIKEKMKKTNLEKYGVEYASQNDEIKTKTIKTFYKKFGVSNPMKNKKVKEKCRKTNLEKYGVEYPIQNKEIQNKIEKTNIKKYNCKNPSQNEKVKEKRKKTNKEKYGYEYSCQNNIVKNKTRITRENKNIWVKEENISEFTKYRNKINNLTKKNWKILFENWDGYDYYEPDDYIKNNFKLHYLDISFPTIDHIKSVHMCFIEGLSTEEASDISNLCFTKRSINSSKKNKNISRLEMINNINIKNNT